MMKLIQSLKRKTLTHKETGMDTLVGSMVGVLLLSIITVTFVGIYMAYVATGIKSQQNTARYSAAADAIQETITQMYIDHPVGYIEASSNGWTLISQPGVNLGYITGVNPASEWSNFTYAATKYSDDLSRPVNVWGTLISDPNSPERGMIKIYAAVQKSANPGSLQLPPRCDWTMTHEALLEQCTLVHNTVQSVYAPPPRYEAWEEIVHLYQWVGNTLNGTGATQTLPSGRIGEISIDENFRINEATNTATVKWVLMVSSLPADTRFSIDLQSSFRPDTYHSVLVDPSGNTSCETSGTITCYLYGEIVIEDADIMFSYDSNGIIEPQPIAVYLDVKNPVGGTVAMSRLQFYQVRAD